MALLSGQYLTKFIGKNIRRVWRARREARNKTQPEGWFERAVDWVDLTLSKVPVGRNNNPDLKRDEDQGKDEGKGGTRGQDDDDVWESVSNTVTDSASWESLTSVGAGSASTSSDGSSGGAEVVDPAQDDEKKPSSSSQSRTEQQGRKGSKSSASLKARADPLADRSRKPDFVFTLGGTGAGEEDDIAVEGQHREDTRRGGHAGGASTPSGGHGGGVQSAVFSPTLSRDGATDVGMGSRRTTAYQREKPSARMGDAVTRLTQDDAASNARARAKAAAAKKSTPTGTGVVADVHTDITVLYPDTFDDVTSLARRPSDGVGLDKAGGLGEVWKGKMTNDVNKRRWLVAFCTRWAPSCNLLVREFALLGSRPELQDFSLGWVDCTSARMAEFCGGRFKAEGYPMIVLITGGRMVRYSAVNMERIAGAIAPWAVARAAEVDAFAPNRGGDESPPGTAVPDPTSSPSVPQEGARGARAFGEIESDELRRNMDKQRKLHEKEEERRLAKQLADEARRQRVVQSGTRKQGRDAGGSAASGTTTAPKMSRRRRAKLAAAEKKREL